MKSQNPKNSLQKHNDLNPLVKLPYHIVESIDNLSTRGRIQKVIASAQIENCDKLSIYKFLL